ncbi:hypothetical protein [Anabaenopsis elenkinii]|uniref:Uncharacterized protein n=1 Tax=Anabaenopsis elenkinii CCIBt3563 TaxID=2779889 RepID=A0A7U3RYC6_9CYAN|nr:hypothetical protein [Anabaenopsis elenkinii]QOV21251.1 hypothetical protein IM676_10715 [Anabaenopsis elenkinii CCIBt3563]
MLTTVNRQPWSVSEVDSDSVALAIPSTVNRQQSTSECLAVVVRFLQFW